MAPQVRASPGKTGQRNRRINGNKLAIARADVALFDLPPVLHNDDVAAFLPQVDGVLLVSDGSQTTARHLKACEKMLAGHTQLLGVVLNRARSEDEFSGGA